MRFPAASDPRRTQLGSAGGEYYLWGTGLPTKTALNVFVTDPSGKEGFPIGVQESGNLEWLRMYAEYAGPAPIEITGPTKKNGEARAYATCAVTIAP